MSVTRQPGDPTWVDLYTADLDRAIAFYGELFGWTAERGGEEFGGYTTLRKDGKAVAGAMSRMPDDADPFPDRWTVYLSSFDAAATTTRAVNGGGNVFVGPMAVGDLGTMAVLADVGGVGVGVWQADQFAGFEAIGEVGDGVWSEHAGVPSWFELMTRSYESSLSFYREVFGWNDSFTVADSPEFRYTTIHATSPMRGGVMDGGDHLPEGVPGAWTVYFGADDVDKTAEHAKSLGGTIVFDPMDTPYGRMAGLTDPTGAHFSIGGNTR
ncbi:VOC family protein [Nocardia asteroides]|uniref:VOC family protein n=1 Tax=Nocardia asteroides TaxID=1824 RepID=UPI001E4B7047|nr:VOC family protein [Nocardia asteroides]UGT57107.1 VOC family protein [Nocardia asteroides]